MQKSNLPLLGLSLFLLLRFSRAVSFTATMKRLITEQYERLYAANLKNIIYNESHRTLSAVKTETERLTDGSMDGQTDGWDERSSSVLSVKYADGIKHIEVIATKLVKHLQMQTKKSAKHQHSAYLFFLLTDCLCSPTVPTPAVLPALQMPDALALGNMLFKDRQLIKTIDMS